MKSFFSSNFDDVKTCHLDHNLLIIEDGKKLYTQFLRIIKEIQKINDDEYVPVQTIHEFVKNSPYVMYSKKKIYEKYSSGVIAGAGSSEDCVSLIKNSEWKLFDLTDKRMIRSAIGYKCGKAKIRVVNYDSSGDTLISVRKELIREYLNINVISIDELNLDKCEIISGDVEGAGMDLLGGSIKTMKRLSPDILISIYHNWSEFLHVIPFLHNNGYTVRVIYTATDTPFQPHLELSVFASKRDLYSI